MKLSDDATSLVTNIGKARFNAAFKACPVVLGMRSVYVRKTAVPSSFDAYDVFTKSFTNTNNQLNTDFKMYSTLADARADANAWTFCDYGDQAGFPRNCGPSAAVTGYQFFTMPGATHASGVGAATNNNFLKIFIGEDCPATAQPCPPARVRLSSTYSGYDAARCIDGDHNTACAVANKGPNPFLVLEYNNPVKIRRVKVINRKDCCEARTKNMYVTVSNNNPVIGQLADHNPNTPCGYSMQCCPTLTVGEVTSTSEENVGHLTLAACIATCRRKDNVNGITVGKGISSDTLSKDCWCVTELTGINSSSKYEGCVFQSIATMLGKPFVGPGTNEQEISFESTGEPPKSGKYVVVQLRSEEAELNLADVTAYGYC